MTCPYIRARNDFIGKEDTSSRPGASAVNGDILVNLTPTIDPDHVNKLHSPYKLIQRSG